MIRKTYWAGKNLIYYEYDNCITRIMGVPFTFHEFESG